MLRLSTKPKECTPRLGLLLSWMSSSLYSRKRISERGESCGRPAWVVKGADSILLTSRVVVSQKIRYAIRAK